MARPLNRALACGAAAAVLAVPVLTATPASAADTEYAGATGAFALRLQVNLPDALEALGIDLQIDPVTGTVSTSNDKASATAQVLGSSSGLLKTILDAATPLKGITSANQDNPGPNTNDPLSAVPDALKAILDIGLIKSSSQVADGKSASTASVASIKLALGETLADALGPVTTQLNALQQQAIAAIAAQLPLLTGPLCSSLVDPVIAPVLTTLGLASVANLLCTLPAQLTALSGDLDDALTTLGDNIFSTGLIETSQTIGTEAGKLVARANASIAGLGLLGSTPLGAAGVIQSSATAAANGVKGGASATAVPPILVDTQLGGLDAQLADLQVTLQGLLGSLGNSPITAPLTTVLTQVLDAVNGLLEPLGASVITLDDSNSAVALTSCPTSLTGFQKGTFTSADGKCAAAATRGIGVEVTLPEAVNNLLGLDGPLVTLALAPSAAVAQAAVVTQYDPPPTIDTPDTPDNPILVNLPRTGLEGGLLGGSAIAALLGAAYLRRRRSLV